MDGQGHTCVHHIGHCVSPLSVAEVGHQCRPHKKSVETNRQRHTGHFTLFCVYVCVCL